MKFEFDDENFTAILKLNKSYFEFDKLKDSAKENNLLEKPDLHITIIGRKVGDEIAKKFADSWQDIKNFIQEEIWEFAPKEDIYLISKSYAEYGDELRESIIQEVEFTPLNKFYKKLNELLLTDFKVPFPHVTLFANSTNKERQLRGIGIYSAEELKLLKPKKL